MDRTISRKADWIFMRARACVCVCVLVYNWRFGVLRV